MRDFGLNLAASEPMELFAPEEFDGKGDLHHSPLAQAWIAATICHGSIYLCYDVELQKNRVSAQTFDDMLEDDGACRVTTEGRIQAGWKHLLDDEQQDASPFAFSQSEGEDPKGRCLQDSISSFSKLFKTKELDMSINKWRSIFDDACQKGSIVCANGFSRQLRIFGADLALSRPRSLFMAHKWVCATHLRPKPHSTARLGAIASFGPLWLHQDTAMMEEVTQKMNSDEIDESDEGCESAPDVKVVETVEDEVEDVTNSRRESQAASPDAPAPKGTIEDDAATDQDSDAESAATAPAGIHNLQDAKLPPFPTPL
jgi:hypothetical protein